MVDTKSYCKCFEFQGVDAARGYNYVYIGRATLIMSNIFMQTGLIWLASEAAGCTTVDGEITETCETRIYGLYPASLIPSIATVSGLASALFMPYFGAIVDYTNYRRVLGIASAIVIFVIQASQIFTNSRNWFLMAVLQAVAGFLFNVQVLLNDAYLPEIARLVNEMEMAKFTSTFALYSYITQLLFMIVLAFASVFWSMNSVESLQLGQALNCVCIIILWICGWKLLPSAPKRHSIPVGSYLPVLGFAQIFKTMRDLMFKFDKIMLWYFTASIFANAGTSGFTTIILTFMSSLLRMSVTEVSFAFLIAIVTCVPGVKMGEYVTSRTDPHKSWKYCLLALTLVTIVAANVMIDETTKNWAYIFASLWGICLGWYSPVKLLFFSVILPKDQETEFSGFNVYSGQILVWLPPLFFTMLVEYGFHMKWGLMSFALFFIIAFFILCMIPEQHPSFEKHKTIEATHPTSIATKANAVLEKT